MTALRAKLQAVREESRKPKPRALLIPIDRCLVVWVEKPGEGATIVCVGPKRHYRKHGGCTHIDRALGRMTGEVQARTTVVGWGGKPGEGVSE